MFRKSSVMAIGFVIAVSGGNAMAEVVCDQAQMAAPTRAMDNGGAWQRNGQGNGIQPVKGDMVISAGSAWHRNTQGNSIIGERSSQEVSRWGKNSEGNGINPCSTEHTGLAAVNNVALINGR